MREFWKRYHESPLHAGVVVGSTWALAILSFSIAAIGGAFTHVAVAILKLAAAINGKGDVGALWNESSFKVASAAVGIILPGIPEKWRDVEPASEEEQAFSEVNEDLSTLVTQAEIDALVGNRDNIVELADVKSELADSHQDTSVEDTGPATRAEVVEEEKD